MKQELLEAGENIDRREAIADTCENVAPKSKGRTCRNAGFRTDFDTESIQPVADFSQYAMQNQYP
jgi:hypothetical protein